MRLIKFVNATVAQVLFCKIPKDKQDHFKGNVQAMGYPVSSRHNVCMGETNCLQGKVGVTLGYDFITNKTTTATLFSIRHT